MKIKEGIIISDKMNKTRIVLNKIIIKHKKYRKTILKKKKYYVHDEKNITKKGDLVKIIETRPLSKKKRWIIKKIINKKK
ncbi:30S ribosomal protein S17 [Candidatus Shikimatogenerans bostrichidophilus]|uniref:30S ribosomal protein S17 n=1 Tax=Candidatus Shikimatogenerans bostrichidophilus TaxID=2943807 RepID=UPI002967743E